jgi:O-antigen/teichoic acid export membrane protein
LSEVWYFLPAALASSLLPALVRSQNLTTTIRQQRVQRFYDLNAGLAYALIFCLAPSASRIFPLVFGRGYAGADAVFTIHIWSCLFVFLGMARNQCLLIEGRTRFLFLCTALGAVVNVALNLMVIPLWGAAGAAFTTLISQASATFLSSFVWGPARPHGYAQLRALLVPIRALLWLTRPVR